MDEAPRISRAFGEWLDGRKWDHFATLTFRYDVSIEEAERQVKRWIRRLQQQAQQDVEWFWVGEYGAGGLLHVHALTAGTASLSGMALSRSWAAGRAHSDPYNGSRGAAFYVSKDLTKPNIHYDFRFSTPL